MVLVTGGEGSGPTRALLLCAAVGGLFYGLYLVLSIGRRGRRLPPGWLYLLFDILEDRRMFTTLPNQVHPPCLS